MLVTPKQLCPMKESSTGSMMNLLMSKFDVLHCVTHPVCLRGRASQPIAYTCSILPRPPSQGVIKAKAKC